VPELPRDIGAAPTAALIQAMLAGQAPVPAPIEQQVRCLLALRERLFSCGSSDAQPQGPQD